MALTAAAWGQAILRPLPPHLQPSPTRRHLPFWISARTAAADTTTVVRVSPRPGGGGRGGKEEEEKEGSMSSIDTSRLLSDDFYYLWKLAAGSIGGASAVKYGSVLFPDITRPNIVQALLMISLPVLVAILILIKESSKDVQDEELL
ncbi:unnamed protein product [Musa acuminata subsp. malaccensis]|uniref:(wild Malaysian banana) hypothetical protein n=1 Tax=Musa acuminata subsp. malaccensis TaxID=214687 RepID=A0A804KPC8_MUSAM|nr:PREDICTED: uncharacterized protein LOC103999152 [Musa acuminata subsp. malaccensis]CAG1836657.1 unnamed protein product [Musa acuminata subsp. malaccensis]